MLFNKSKDAAVLNMTASVFLILLLTGFSLFMIFDSDLMKMAIPWFLITVSIAILTFTLGKALMPFALITLEKGNDAGEDPETVTLITEGRRITFKDNHLPKHCRVFFSRRGKYKILWEVKIKDQALIIPDEINLYDLTATSDQKIYYHEPH